MAWKRVLASSESRRLQSLHGGWSRACGPTGLEEGLFAPPFGAVVLRELGQADALLELDYVLGHGEVGQICIDCFRKRFAIFRWIR